MISECNKRKVDQYFNKNYNHLLRYSRKIVQDQNRTFDAEEIISELYIYLQNKQNIDTEKLDQFCKAWLSLTIVKGRSFANLKLSIRDGIEINDTVKITEENAESITEFEFEYILNKLTDKKRKIILTLIDAKNTHDLCFKTGIHRNEIKKEVREARAAFLNFYKQII